MSCLEGQKEGGRRAGKAAAAAELTLSPAPRRLRITEGRSQAGTAPQPRWEGNAGVKSSHRDPLPLGGGARLTSCAEARPCTAVLP